MKIADAKNALGRLRELREPDDVSSFSPRNITRIYSTAQWLDEYADFLEQYEDKGLIACTSHYLMYEAQNISYTLNPTTSFGYMPIHMELRTLGTFAEDIDSVPVLDHSNDNYNRSTVLSINSTDNDKWIIGGNVRFENDITSYDDEEFLYISLSSLADPDSGENMSFDCISTGTVSTAYTLREYAQALRDYYALVDPLPSKTALNGFDDDFTNAKKELKDAEDIVSSKYARLKKAQKDYEEAVVLLTVNTALPEEAAAGSEILPTSAATDGMPMYTGKEFNETYSTATDNNSLSETTSDTDDKKHNVIADNASASVTEKANTPPVTTAIDLSYVDAVNEDDNTNKNSVKQNGILLQVLSYIFNGGAIAVIIPTGFRRRKKSIEEEIIPNKKAPGKAL